VFPKLGVQQWADGVTGCPEDYGAQTKLSPEEEFDLVTFWVGASILLPVGYVKP